MAGRLLFSTIDVTRQVFYKSSKSFAIVNLKPIVPGHVLVIPRRPVLRLAELDDSELFCLMKSINEVGSVVQKVYQADALTVACQDGKAAGQSVPHVHFHILPRKLKGDRFSENNDEIYPELERSEGSLPKDFEQTYTPLNMDADVDRPPRTLDDMEKEATWLGGHFEEKNN